MFIYFRGNWHLAKTINKRSSRNADSVSHGNLVEIYCMQWLPLIRMYCRCHSSMQFDTFCRETGHDANLTNP